MAKIFGQLEKAQLENTTSDTGSLPKGMATYRTDLNVAKVSDGSTMKELVDTSTAQTLTNKTLTSPTLTTPNTEVIGLDGQASTPSTPAAGFYKAYVKDSTGKLTVLNSAGTETTVGGGGSSGINYISNPDAETDTTGWVLYEDAAAASPVDGTGVATSNEITFTRTTSSPLRSVASFLITKDAANRQGEGVGYAFTIDPADQGKVLQGSFDYAIASGTFADNDISVWIYDVTNAVLIQPAPYLLKNHSLPSERMPFEFQTAINSTSYRLILHVASTSVSAYTVKLDNVSIGPAAKLYGSPVTDWVAYTPTIANLGTGSTSANAATWRRVGDTIEVVGHFVKDGSGGSGASAVTLTLPSGLSVNATKLSNNTGALDQTLGTASILSTTNRWEGTAQYFPTDKIGFVVQDGGSGDHSLIGSDAVANSIFSYKFAVPITGWSSSVIMSSDADTRVTVAAAYGAGTNAMTTGTQYVLSMQNETYDTHGAQTTGGATNGTTTKSGWYYTAPSAGYYQVTSQISTNSAVLAANSYASCYLRKNGSGSAAAMGIVAGDAYSKYESINGTQILFLNAGDYVELMFETSVTAVTLANNQGSSVNVMKVQGPAQIAASDSVSALYTGVPTGSIGSNWYTLTYPTKAKDTHSAYSAGTYTIPVSGTYSISASVNINATHGGTNGSGINVYVDGVSYQAKFEYPGGSVTSVNPSVHILSIPLLAGQLITIRAYTDGVTPSYAGASQGHFSIVRTGNY